MTTDKYSGMADSIVRQYVREVPGSIPLYIVDYNRERFRGCSPQKIRHDLAIYLREEFSKEPHVIDLR